MHRSQKDMLTSRFRNFLFFAPLVLLSACAGGENVAPEKETVSFFTGEKVGFSLGGQQKQGTAGNSIPVNALLWRAALDIASYVPLDDIDTFAGSIVTEWHAPKSNPDQRLKLTIFVIGKELRSDGIKVTAYIQKRLGSGWTDAGRDEKLGRDIEGLILSRARELRAAVVAETVE
jgi:hypothetical protein